MAPGATISTSASFMYRGISTESWPFSFLDSEGRGRLSAINLIG